MFRPLQASLGGVCIDPPSIICEPIAVNVAPETGLPGRVLGRNNPHSAATMPSIEYDGIYGESDHWLTEGQVAAANQEIESLSV